MATHSSSLAWRIPWTEEPDHRAAKSWTQLKRLSTHAHIYVPICRKHISLRETFHLEITNGRDLVHKYCEALTQEQICILYRHPARNPPNLGKVILYRTVLSLKRHGREDSLEEETATHSSTLAWKIPWTEEPGRLQSMGLHRVRHKLEAEHARMTMINY